MEINRAKIDPELVVIGAVGTFAEMIRGVIRERGGYMTAAERRFVALNWDVTVHHRAGHPTRIATDKIRIAQDRASVPVYADVLSTTSLSWFDGFEDRRHGLTALLADPLHRMFAGDDELGPPRCGPRIMLLLSESVFGAVQMLELLQTDPHEVADSAARIRSTMTLFCQSFKLNRRYIELIHLYN